MKKKRNPLSLNITLIIIIFFGSILLYKRYFSGIGSVSNLNDDVPWGLWVFFDLLFIAFSSTAFVFSFFFYILRDKDFEPFIKLALAIGISGYLSAIALLMIETGRPWNLYKPLFIHNYGSIMWEVSLCIASYTLILILENFKDFKPFDVIFKKSLKIMVIIGVCLSILHQSSLGGLFLMAKNKIHEFWYSPIIPVNFLLTSISVSFVFLYLFLPFGKKNLEKQVLIKFYNYSSISFLVFWCFRIGEILFKIYNGKKIENIFLVFILIEVFVFMLYLMLSFSKIATYERKLDYITFLILFETAFYRLKISFLSYLIKNNLIYYPSLSEILLLVLILVFYYLVLKFTIKVNSSEFRLLGN